MSLPVTVTGPWRRRPRGTNPSTTRAGRPISRAISAIAAAYCSPSPTMRSPASSDVIRSAPCPESDGVVAGVDDAVAEVALLREPGGERLGDLHRVAGVARDVRGRDRRGVRHAGQLRLRDVRRRGAAHLVGGGHARDDDVDAVAQAPVHAVGQHRRARRVVVAQARRRGRVGDVERRRLTHGGQPDAGEVVDLHLDVRAARRGRWCRSCRPRGGTRPTPARTRRPRRSTRRRRSGPSWRAGSARPPAAR